MSRIDLKLLLYAINGILFILAILLVVIGVKWSKIPGPPINNDPASIVLGTFIVFTIILGLIAFRLKQTWLNIIHLVLLICVLGGLLVTSIMAIVVDPKMKITSFLTKAYLMRPKDRIDHRIIDFQSYFQCCGYGLNSSDVLLQDLIYLSQGDRPQNPENATYLIPECCPLQPIVCTKLAAFKDSCLDKILREHKEWTNIILAPMIISILAIVAAGALNIKRMTQFI
ncbi:uncharacterized protein [Euwallacea similis]|uniref:uncharacterized protein n=1 Tax=Euwallacea similis TaxID=1736056 RepID=UPI00344B5454